MVHFVDKISGGGHYMLLRIVSVAIVSGWFVYAGAARIPAVAPVEVTSSVQYDCPVPPSQ